MAGTSVRNKSRQEVISDLRQRIERMGASVLPVASGGGNLAVVPDVSGNPRSAGAGVNRGELRAADSAVLGATALKVTPLRGAAELAQEASGDEFSGQWQHSFDPEKMVRVDGPLAPVWRGAGLPRAAITETNHCAAFSVELIRTITEQGGWAAVIGGADLLFAGVSEGGNLDRVIWLPELDTEQVLNAASLCAESCDLVLVQHSGTHRLGATASRSFQSKVRAGRAAVVMDGWVGARNGQQITAQVTGAHGLEAGWGRVRALSMRVDLEAKGVRHSTNVVLGNPSDAVASAAAQVGSGRRPRMWAVS